jgi:hypothetical protein
LLLLSGTLQTSAGSTRPWHALCREPMIYPPSA